MKRKMVVQILLILITAQSLIQAKLPTFLSSCPGYYGQCCQDKYLAYLFKRKRNGVFIEVGAHDGISYSNTFYFEKKLKWTGFCFEPNPEKFQELVKNRAAICVNACVSDKTGSVDFLKLSGDREAEMLSGILSCYNAQHLERIDKQIEQIGGSKELISIASTTLSEFLKKQDVHRVDLVCIDTEGSELSVLKSIDFNQCYFDVIMVENNYRTTECKDFMEAQGFSLIHTIYPDEIYRNNRR